MRNCKIAVHRSISVSVTAMPGATPTPTATVTLVVGLESRGSHIISNYKFKYSVVLLVIS